MKILESSGFIADQTSGSHVVYYHLEQQIEA